MVAVMVCVVIEVCMVVAMVCGDSWCVCVCVCVVVGMVCVVVATVCVVVGMVCKCAGRDRIGLSDSSCLLQPQQFQSYLSGGLGFLT